MSTTEPPPKRDTTNGALHVQDVRARWLGHIVRAEVTVAVEPEHHVREGDAIADAVGARLAERVEFVADSAVRVRGAA